MPRHLILIAALAAMTSGASASGPDSLNIVDHITANGVNTVVQPAALSRMLQREQSVAAPVNDESETDTEKAATASKSRVAGYRVQVFSDNNASTARNEARAKSRNISERFPEMRTYVIYNSPYWRLKVGDFRSRREAEDAAEEIRQAFPSYAKEIRVVRDRINAGN